MSAAFEDALDKFKLRIDDSLNLIAIHKDLGRIGTGGSPSGAPRRGRRYRELALNHAVVVLTVAAWQAYVEDLITAAIGSLQPPPGDGAVTSFRVMKGVALNVRHNFSTPNAENTRDVLMTVGYDPWDAWRWPASNGSSQRARTTMNQWLKVRHAIAHGDSFPEVDVLHTTDSGNKTLRRANAEDCIHFFLRMAEQTSAHAISFFTT